MWRPPGHHRPPHCCIEMPQSSLHKARDQVKRYVPSRAVSSSMPSSRELKTDMYPNAIRCVPCDRVFCQRHLDIASKVGERERDRRLRDRGPKRSETSIGCGRAAADSDHDEEPQRSLLLEAQAPTHCHSDDLRERFAGRQVSTRVCCTGRLFTANLGLSIDTQHIVQCSGTPKVDSIQPLQSKSPTQAIEALVRTIAVASGRGP